MSNSCHELHGAADFHHLCQTLSPGRHPEVLVKFLVGLRVSGAEALSPRLLFLTALDSHQSRVDIIVKTRDGYFAEEDIKHLNTLLPSEDIELLEVQGFIEVEEVTSNGEKAFLHLSAVELRAEGLRADGFWLEGLRLPQPRTTLAHKSPGSDQPRQKSKVSGSWAGANNKNRASVFVRWLLGKFGLEVLCSGAGVLDVAGGSGQVAFMLTCRHRIPSTIVDPREATVSKKQRNYFLRCAEDAQYQRGALYRSSIACSDKIGNQEMEAAGLMNFEAEALRGTEAKQHSPCAEKGENDDGEGLASDCLSEQQIDCGDGEDPSIAQPCSHSFAQSRPLPPYVKTFMDEAERIGIFSSLPAQLRMPLPRHLAQLFDSSFATDEASSDVWARCSVAVGMHPDQATEPLLDLCLQVQVQDHKLASDWAIWFGYW